MDHINRDKCFFNPISEDKIRSYSNFFIKFSICLPLTSLQKLFASQNSCCKLIQCLEPRQLFLFFFTTINFPRHPIICFSNCNFVLCKYRYNPPAQQSIPIYLKQDKSFFILKLVFCFFSVLNLIATLTKAKDLELLKGQTSLVRMVRG